MKTRDEMVDAWRPVVDSKGEFDAPWGPTCMFLDSRDLSRFIGFFSLADARAAFPGVIKDDLTDDTWGSYQEWNAAGVREQAARDFAFGKEKADDERGISSELMFYVCKMWAWALEDEELLHIQHCGDYGKSFFSAAVAKYPATTEATNV